VFEAGETYSSVFVLEEIVILHRHALLLEPTLDMFVLFTCRKWIVRIVLEVRIKETLSVVFPWVSNIFAQHCPGAGVCFCLRLRQRLLLRLQACGVFKIIEVGKRIQVFDGLFVSVEFKKLSGINTLGRTAQ
jgi:hypothetical protein